MSIIQLLTRYTGITGALLLSAGLFFSPALVSIGSVLIFLQLFLYPPEEGIGTALKRHPVILFAIALYLLHLISVFYTSDIGYVNWLNDIRIKLPLLLIPLGLLSQVFREKDNFYLIHACFILVAALAASLTFMNYLGNYEEINALVLESKPIPISGGLNHIYFSIFLAYAILSGLFIMFSLPRGNRLVLIISILTALNFIFIHIIAARTGLVALYLALGMAFLYFFIIGGKRYLTGMTLLLVLAASMFIAISQFGSLANRFENTKKDLYVVYHGKNPNYWSIAQRYEALANAWRVYKRHPLWGSSMGDLTDEIQYQYEYDKTLLLPENRLMPHNQYFSFLAGLGIPGLLLFLLLLFSPLLHHKSRNNLLFFSILMLCAFSFLAESALQRQMGVSFFSFFFVYIAMASGWLSTGQLRVKSEEGVIIDIPV